MRKKRLLTGLDTIRHIIPESESPAVVAQGLEYLNYGKYTTKYTHTVSNNRIFINSILPSFPGKAWNRFFDGAHRIGNGERVPLWLDIVATGRCHCDCWHCFRSNFADRSDLELSVLESIIHDAYELGTVILGITGGEPMLHRDLLEVIHMVPEGMELQLYSTGHQIHESFIQETEDSQLTRCIISLDHFSPEIINSRRNNTHAFDEAVRSLQLLSQSTIYASAALCITQDLCDEEALYRYLDLVCTLAVDEIRVILPIPQGKQQGVNHKRLYLDARKALHKIREETADDEDIPSIVLFGDLESKGCFGCGAGFHYLAVNNDGCVNPCVAVPLSFGDVHRLTLREIYAGMENYFKSSGTTCLGRRLDRVCTKKGFASDIHPYSLEDSKMLSSHCMVDGPPADFFAHLVLQ
jgi:MoaA/NifB/PqqE/SkfB family radical SAM enzyme